MKQNPLIAKLTDYDYLSKVSKKANEDQRKVMKDTRKSICNPCFDGDHHNCVSKRCECEHQPEEWEERFKKKFLGGVFNKYDLRAFISKEIQSAYNRGVKEGVAEYLKSKLSIVNPKKE